ncbi:MAG: hypothetical protein GY810_02405 [Aureispira sp.]|nr:hypothetical protein [Aureispira sp.]
MSTNKQTNLKELIVLGQKYSQLCAAAGLEEQAAKKLKQIKIIGALSKKALKNIAESSTPDPLLPDDLVKLLHELLPVAEDYERILPLVEQIYEKYITKAETEEKAKLAREVLESVLLAKQNEFSEYAFEQVYWDHFKTFGPDVPSNVPRTELSVKFVDREIGNNATLEGKLNMVPTGKSPAAFNLDVTKTGSAAIEAFKQELALKAGGEFTTKVAQANIGKWLKGVFGMNELFDSFPNWLTGDVEVAILEFGGKINSLGKKDQKLSLNLFNVTINIKIVIPPTGDLWIFDSANFNTLREVVNMELEGALTFEVKAPLEISDKAEQKILKKLLADQKKLEREYSKTISNFGEYLNNQDDLKGDAIKNMSEILEVKGKTLKPQRLKMIERIAEQRNDLMLKKWVTAELKKQDKKLAKFKKQLDKLYELSSKFKKLEQKFAQKAAKLSSTFLTNGRKLLGRRLTSFAMKAIPGLNIISTAVDIYDIGKVVVPMIWEALKENGDGIKRVPIPDRVKMLFDWMNEFGSKQYQILEELPETQIKAYLKFLNSFEDNQAVVDFVKKLMTHSSAGKMLALDNPDAIKALYDAQTTFEREEEVNNGLKKLNIGTTVSFESAEWVDITKKEHLKVTKQVIFDDLPNDAYLVDMSYEVELIHDIELQEAYKYTVKRTILVNQDIRTTKGIRNFVLGGTDRADFTDNEDPNKQLWEKR